MRHDSRALAQQLWAQEAERAQADHRLLTTSAVAERHQAQWDNQVVVSELTAVGLAERLAVSQAIAQEMQQDAEAAASRRRGRTSEFNATRDDIVWQLHERLVQQEAFDQREATQRRQEHARATAAVLVEHEQRHEQVEAIV